MTSTDHQGFLAFGISDNQNLGVFDVMKGSDAVIGTTPNNVQYYSYPMGVGIRQLMVLDQIYLF